MTLTAPTARDALRRRAARVQATPATLREPHDLLVLPLMLPPRVWPLLRCVGEHPLLDRFALATVLERDPFDTWELLRTLRAQGLCQTWQPQRHGHAWRYSLTTRGTALLALAAGLSPSEYRRTYAVLDDARRSGEHGLSYARSNIEHTDGISAVYLAFLAAARERGGCLWWHGEWACTRTYRARDHGGVERKYTLRPDAELRYDGPGGPFRAFVEVDRANESATQLAGKIKQYYDYRTVSHDDHFAVLFVTPGPKRGEGPLTAARMVSHNRRVPPLDVYATTAGALSPEGPWAPVWWDADGTGRPLLPHSDHPET